MTRAYALIALLLASVSPNGHRPVNGEPVLFRTVRVFDGIRMLPAQDVLIADGKIARMGQGIAAPAGALVIDGRGRTLLPGLIDSHTHIFEKGSLEEALAFGVTTELDMFSVIKASNALKALEATPEGGSIADFRTAGTLATAPGGHGTEYGLTIPTIERPEDAQAFVDARIGEGSDYIKIVYDDGHAYGLHMPTISRATLQALSDAAHRRRMMAVVHIGTLADARDALNAGVDGLVHLFVDSMPDPGFGRLAASHHAFVVPTLSVLKSVTGVSAGAELVKDSSLAPYIRPEMVENLGRSFTRRPSVTMHYEAAAAAIHQLKTAGVPILAGTDAPNPGTAHGSSLHGELALLVEAGLTPVEALQAATSTPARVFHLADRGRIAMGLRADLLLVEGDPSQDIKMTRHIVGVWKAGVALDRNRWRDQVAAQVLQSQAGASPPAGMESGMISEFDDGTTSSEFGAGWELSTDQIAGGKSVGRINVVSGGIGGSAGSLEVTGIIDPALPYAWAGAMFSPGTTPFTATDLSSKPAIRFFARGDGKTYRIMVFSQAKGQIPLQQTFVAATEWKEYVFPFSAFDGITGDDIMAVLWVGGPAGGPFSFQLDGVKLE
ncbi:MAG: CIA30 family protein [Gemmatimonadota bacterium]